MKPRPHELTFKETSDQELAQAVERGGWVEFHLHCPLCNQTGPHRHYICSACGRTDFAGANTCAECWNMKNTHRIRRWLWGFIEEYGVALKKFGFILVFAIFTIANWRAM